MAPPVMPLLEMQPLSLEMQLLSLAALFLTELQPVTELRTTAMERKARAKARAKERAKERATKERKTTAMLPMLEALLLSRRPSPLSCRAQLELATQLVQVAPTTSYLSSRVRSPASLVEAAPPQGAPELMELPELLKRAVSLPEVLELPMLRVLVFS
jgi:hypothetical protein